MGGVLEGGIGIYLFICTLHGFKFGFVGNLESQSKVMV